MMRVVRVLRATPTAVGGMTRIRMRLRLLRMRQR
jgi:hypothetical protein